MALRQRVISRLASEPRTREQLERVGAEPLVEALRARPEAPARSPAGPVTTALWERLSPDDHVALHERMEGGLRDLWAGSTDEARRRLAVNFAVHYGIDDAIGRMRLQPDMPPDDVHAMARGGIVAGGDPGMADVVVEAFVRAGFSFDPGATVLDFGASSGRVLRALAAWHPVVDWVGCDPNEAAIAWAAGHLRDSRYFVSPVEPPLELADGSVDLVYAISIWSHFDAPAAVRWLDEMHRIVRPGGGLMLTTHGLDTLAHLMRIDRMAPKLAAGIALDLVSGGHRFIDVFGEQGDWGVKHAGWGNAYFAPGWLTSVATPKWSVRLYEPAGLDRNQDVFVLERR